MNERPDRETAFGPLFTVAHGAGNQPCLFAILALLRRKAIGADRVSDVVLGDIKGRGDCHSMPLVGDPMTRSTRRVRRVA